MTTSSDEGAWRAMLRRVNNDLAEARSFVVSLDLAESTHRQIPATDSPLSKRLWDTQQEFQAMLRERGVYRD